MRKGYRLLGLMVLLAGWLMLPARAMAVSSVCGDGMITGNEQCDDGGTKDSDNCCSASCQHTCCGDGMVNGGEQCDDGDSDNSDTCNDNCQSLEDNDGVGQGIEDNCPGYGANGLNTGDGNNDGILDSAQSNVASLPSATHDSCITVQITGCDLNDVTASEPGDHGTGDPGNDYPFGLIGFTLPTCETAQVKVFFHGGSAVLAGSQYRKYGPTTPGVAATTKFYTLPNVMLSTSNFSGTPVVTAMFTLNDNQLGDATGDDNTIVDPSGLAVGPHSVPVTSTAGVAFLAVLMVGIGAFALRRLGANTSH